MLRRMLATGMLLICIASGALAHGGKTDSKGGHTDRSTGEYHYHHGYSAHQHPNGVCPYDFDDKTGEASGAASSQSQNTKANSASVKQKKDIPLGGGIASAVVFFLSIYVLPYLLSGRKKN